MKAIAFFSFFFAQIFLVLFLSWHETAKDLEAQLEAFRADSVRVEVRYEPPPAFIEMFRLDCRWIPREGGTR